MALFQSRISIRLKVQKKKKWKGMKFKGYTLFPMKGFVQMFKEKKTLKKNHKKTVDAVLK